MSDLASLWACPPAASARPTITGNITFTNVKTLLSPDGPALRPATAVLAWLAARSVDVRRLKSQDLLIGTASNATWKPAYQQRAMRIRVAFEQPDGLLLSSRVHQCFKPGQRARFSPYAPAAASELPLHQVSGVASFVAPGRGLADPSVTPHLR